jgi:hypothetical protein
MTGFFDPSKVTEATINKAEQELNAAIESERPDTLAPPEDKNQEKPGFVKEVPVDNGTNWQKRYGDLQRYIDKTIKPKHEAEVKGLKDKLAELEAKVNSLVNKSAPADMPSSVAEIEALKQESPGAYAAIVALATNIAEGIVANKVKDYDSKFAEVTEAQKKNRDEADYIELKRRHPDLDELAENEQFHTWLQSQPAIFQKAIYGVEGQPKDVDAADGVLKMYKAAYPKDGTKQTKKKASGKDDVNLSSQPDLPSKGSSWDFSESQIEAMDKKNPNWFEKNAEAIDKAIREGRILRDISDPHGSAVRVAAQAA